MAMRRLSPQNDPMVRAAIKQAWEDSNPGNEGGSEEGGFVLRDLSGNFSVERWPKGLQASIMMCWKENENACNDFRRGA